MSQSDNVTILNKTGDMFGFSYTEFFLILLVLVCIGLILTIVLLVWRQRAVLMPKKAEDVILDAEERANAIIAEANAEARRLRASMEKERMKALNEDKHALDRFLDAYRHKLGKVIKELTYGIEKEHMRVTSSFVESLQSIEERVSLNAEEAKHSMDSFTNQSGVLFERLSYEIENVEEGIQHLALALEEAAENESDKNAEIVRQEMKKIGEQTAKSVVKVAKGLDEVLKVNLEKEFKSISKEIGEYREARMRLINERIVVLIEETAQIALQKKLSMQDHADLVYRSLEEAKQRGVFV
jgi:adenylate kinase family enzyme